MKFAAIAVAIIGLVSGSSAIAAPTTLQWGIDRTVSPWYACVYDSNNICQGIFALPATGGSAYVPTANGGLGPVSNLIGYLYGNGASQATASATIPWAVLTGTPTTLAGYGIASPLPVAQGGSGATTLSGYVFGNGTGPETASATIPLASLTPIAADTVVANVTGSTAAPTAASMSSVLGAAQQGTVASRSVFYDLPAATVAAILAGTNTTPTGPGASGDLSTSIQTTINTVSAAGGGAVTFPSAPGTYWMCGVTLPRNVGMFNTYGANLEATANCPTGPLLTASASGQGNAWNDITRMLQSTASAGSSAIVAAGYTGDVQAGHGIYLQGDYDSGLNTAPLMSMTVQSVQQNTPSAGLTTINFTSTLSYVASAGNPWRDISDPQIVNVTLSGVKIDGNVLNQTSDYRNVVNATTPPTSGSVALNSSSDIVVGTTAYFYFGSNIPVRICTTASESANITITGFKRMSNFSLVSLSQTLALPSNGCTQTDVNHWFQKITGVSVSANMNGSLFVGIPYGQQSASCFTASAPNYNLQDYIFQHCKGFTWVSNWTAGNGGFNSPEAGPLLTASNANLAVGYQGLAWIDGPNDCKLSKIIPGYSFNIGFWLDRQSGGCNVTDSHIYFGTPGSQYNPISPNWLQAYYGWLIDCDSCTLSDTKAEQSATAQVLIRANNVTINHGLYFDAFAASTLSQQSACFEIGDSNYNTSGPAEYIIDSQCKGPGGSAVYFGLDGGLGYVHVVGDNPFTSLAAGASMGATTVQLACGACAGFLAQGMEVTITLNSGVQQVALGAYNSGTGLWALGTPLSGAAAASCNQFTTSSGCVFQATAPNGTPNVTPNTGRSTIALEMFGTYLGYFSQAAP